MKTIFAALILFISLAVPAYAQQPQNTTAELNAEIARMDDAQKVEALKSIRAGRSNAASAARDWVEIGNALGEGMAATAEKMGMVANDFAKSPLGKLAIVLIVWNYMGESIVLITMGFTILIGGTLVWLYQVRKTFGTYDDKGKFIQYNVNAIQNIGGGGLAVAFVVVELLIMGAGVITIANAV